MGNTFRREFIKQSAAAMGGVIMGAPYVNSGWAKSSPNNTINIAVISIRSREGYYGGSVLGLYRGQGKRYRRRLHAPPGRLR